MNRRGKGAVAVEESVAGPQNVQWVVAMPSLSPLWNESQRTEIQIWSGRGHTHMLNSITHSSPESEDLKCPQVSE